MNLQRLRYLVAVADAPSLSAAARRLGVSQPVLSRAIRQLERELGLPLVVLDGRRLRVDPGAAAVVGAAREALDAVERVRVVAGRRHDPTVTIAASPSHQSLLTAMLPELTGCSGASVRLLPARNTDEVCRLVRTAEADVGFGEALGVSEDLTVHPLGELELVLAAATGSELPDPIDLAQRPPLEVAVLASPERHGLLDKLVAEAGGALEPVFEAADRSVLLRAVESAVAPTIAPRVLVAANPLLEVRSLRPRLAYAVVAVTDPRATAPAVAAVVEALAAAEWR